MRLLLVEDDPELSGVLKQGLAEDGYAVDLSLDGEDGLWRATTVDYDVAVLDISLPKLSGLEVLRQMRAKGRKTPVLLLTARDEIDDRVCGLDSGADDYVVKPFAWEELLARLRALLRRGPQGSDGLLRYRDVTLDPARHAATVGGDALDLTAKEFQLLHMLISEPERVFSRTQISEKIYDDDHDGMSNTVEVFVSRLRKKLSSAGESGIIRTVRGVGYALGGGHGA